jgi:hypothetical protein
VENRIPYFDIARTFAVLAAYAGHILTYQNPGSTLTNVVLSYTPGASMSLLGFISAILVTPKNLIITNEMITKRIVRIYIPMLLCLMVAFVFSRINTPWGYDINHVLFHALGLSLFFDFFNAPNNAGVGYGLWFITAIVISYLTLPIQIKLLNHRNGKLHLVFLLLFFLYMKLHLVIDSSPWVVFASFSLGVYSSVKNKTNSLFSMNLTTSSLLLLAVSIISYISVVKGIYWLIPLLTPAYPLVMIPFFKGMCRYTPRIILKGICFFSLISYEFYILQFSFINTNLTKLINIKGLVYHVAISFFILIIVSYLINKLASILINKTTKYIEN